MEKKVGEVFNDGNDLIRIVEWGGYCDDCYYACGINNNDCRRNGRAKQCVNDGLNIKFIKTGESKMDNKEELKRSLAEERQRAKDSLANVEKMKKQLEELNKKEEHPTVSATGVYLNKISDNRYVYLGFDNEIFETVKFNEELETDLMRINNIFATEKQAEQEALRREGQEFIRRCAMLWNKGNDWRKKVGVEQYCIRFNNNTVDVDYFSNNHYGQIVFDNEKLAEKCIAELKSKYNAEQLKTIFGVI